MKFVIIGHGFVGQAIERVLNDRHNLTLIDPKHLTWDERYQEEPDLFRTVAQLATDTKSPINGWIICVPTPEGRHGECDDSLVSRYVFEIQNNNPTAKILIKSTTSVETLGTFTGNVTFSPEFLRGTVSADPTKEFVNAKFMIYGGEGGRWWHDVFTDVMAYNEVRFLDIKTAGFLKYVENSFLATKVMFFNEIRALYDEAIGINYDGMIEALSLDKRINMSHTAVPGPDGKYGFGGHCLPKDSSEFVEYAKLHKNRLELLELARELNLKYRDK